MTNEIIQMKIDDIADSVNKSSIKYGKLLTWHDHRFGDFTDYYGIGLSDKQVFCLGRQSVRMEREDTAIVVSDNPVIFSTDVIIERLKCSLFAFKDWQYDQLKWNGEQLARLIAEDDPLSFNVIKKIGITNCDNLCNTIKGRHKTAKQTLDRYLLTNNLKNLICK